MVHALGSLHSSMNAKYLIRNMSHRKSNMRCHSLVSELLNVEKTTTGSNVRLLQILDAVDDRCTRGTSNSVVVCLANTAECGDVRLDEIMLGQIYNLEQRV